VGAEIVELDVQLTRDGRVVVIHDPRVDRTTDGTGAVAEMDLRQIRELSAGYPQRFGSDYLAERVPTLAEVLSLMRDRALVMIEIKRESVAGENPDEIEARTVAEIRRAGATRGVAFVSFDRDVLLRLRELAPEIRRGHLFRGVEIEQVVEGARAVGSEVAMPHKSMLCQRLWDLAREADLRLATWVIDDPAELAALMRFDLYGVGSNRPGSLLRALDQIS
jgi:glycerophosphoryl diester phosphodiesterase